MNYVFSFTSALLWWVAEEVVINFCQLLSPFASFWVFFGYCLFLISTFYYLTSFFLSLFSTFISTFLSSLVSSFFSSFVYNGFSTFIKSFTATFWIIFLPNELEVGVIIFEASPIVLIFLLLEAFDLINSNIFLFLLFYSSKLKNWT
jgi:hypothetical protein